MAEQFDREYDYHADQYPHHSSGKSHMTPTSASARGWEQMNAYRPESATKNSIRHEDTSTVEEALIDLEQLEIQQEEAERMKALGNKHMAAQEFQRAYNSYSAALQLAPVGPSSHVFLSNRAAALLSLKRYPNAATDARRAIALAPTFGKAHARLGQALYFMKDYAGAVEAYEDALMYEPDNAVTQTYLEKARQKLEKKEQQRKFASEELSLADTMMTPSMSIVTDTVADSGRNAILTGAYEGRNRSAMMHAADGAGEDPDFEEAVKIQQRANAFLQQKKYKSAIEEYTAALFLCPDDPNLSPDLHLGRAHALNGSRRHESAKNDCSLAIKLNPSPAAYSTMAKSKFYLRDYRGAIKAFDDCLRMLPPGQGLGMFDQAYLEKAEAALEEEEASLRQAGSPSRHHHDAKSPIPKLPPPRFVPREQAILETPNLPPMPKQWPQQSPHSPTALKCGPERQVFCLSEALGIKLNRGSDGFVRVLSVTPESPSSMITRRGTIHAGDLLREVAGVDLRRPITNIMWGDTVALIKMAPRPIALIVAQELSPVPPTVLEEQRKAAAASSPTRPSPSSTDQAVQLQEEEDGDNNRQRQQEQVIQQQDIAVVSPPTNTTTIESASSSSDNNHSSAAEVADPSGSVLPSQHSPEIVGLSGSEGDDVVENVGVHVNCDEQVNVTVGGENEKVIQDDVMHTKSLLDEDESMEVNDTSVQVVPVEELAAEPTPSEMIRDKEEKMVDGEILFKRDMPASYCGWDSLRWMSYSGIRRVQFCQNVFRLVKNERKTLFWNSNEEQYIPGALLVYEEPQVILFVRRPSDLNELCGLLDLSNVTEIEEPDTALKKFWVVESVADPVTTKLKLSPLTTITQPFPPGASERERSCFTLLTPVESITLSAVQCRKDVKNSEKSFSDSGSFMETTAAEIAITKLCNSAHGSESDTVGQEEQDILWKHQLILGTLHSAVVSGNQPALEEAIAAALKRSDSSTGSGQLPGRVVNAVDDYGFPPLYYACILRMPGAVQALLQAGADVGFKAGSDGLSPLHLCARNLDDKSLSIILTEAGESMIDPNCLTTSGRTPMFLAAVEGRLPLGVQDSAALERCLALLMSYGGNMDFVDVCTMLAVAWKCRELAVVLNYSVFRFPLAVTDMSLSGYYRFPLHRTLLSIQGHIGKPLTAYESALNTVKVLLEFGFEPNERLDPPLPASPDFPVEYKGFTPLQVLACIAIDIEKSKELFGEEEVRCKLHVVESLAEIIVSNGGRLVLDPPMASRSRKHQDEALHDYCFERRETFCSAVSPKGLTSVLGAESRLNNARKVWVSQKSVAATRYASIISESRASAGFPDSGSPGGSDEKSCAICWKVFGTLMSRRHKCRVSRRFVCDDCATKHLVDAAGEHRVSDGQFNLAKADLVRKEQSRRTIELKTAACALSSVDRNEMQRPKAAAKAVKSKSERETLFGGVLEQASNFVFGEESQADESASEQVGSINRSLEQTRDALNQRGQKLASLGEKSEQMVDASANFAKMAKELRKKSEGGFFW